MLKPFFRFPPPVIALLLQLLALLATFTLAIVISQKNITLPLISLAFLSGFIAALLSHFLGLAKWWLPIQFFFLPSLLGTLSFELSPHWFLLAFLILLAVYWSTFRTQVPLYLSSEKVWQALTDLLPAPQHSRSLTFIDLGCGLGGVLNHLASIRPDGQYFGVESAPFPFLWSWLRLHQKNNCKVHWGSLWDSDLSKFDVVFAYLSPVPMMSLWLKAKNEMRPGSLFISSTFDVPDQLPHQILPIDDLHHSKLLVWKM